jgi:hypothetical protein
MKSLSKLTNMGEKGEKIDVFAPYKGRFPNRNIKEKRRNANRAIQKRARQRLKREIYKDLE